MAKLGVLQLPLAALSDCCDPADQCIDGEWLGATCDGSAACTRYNAGWWQCDPASQVNHPLQDELTGAMSLHPGRSTVQHLHAPDEFLMLVPMAILSPKNPGQYW